MPPSTSKGRAGSRPEQKPCSSKGYQQAALDYLTKRVICRVPCADVHVTLRPSLQRVSEELLQQLVGTVKNAQNFAMILYGERGVGKRLVLQQVIQELGNRVNTEADNPVVGFVTLNGSLLSDERATFRELARQLCATFRGVFAKTASFDENLAFLKTMLHALHRAHKTVVFIVEELEKCARSSKQVLLYNLLDELQSNHTQAAVIGVTSCHDVASYLEKRVYSRFSHRKMVVLPPGEGPDSARAVLESMLALPRTATKLPPAFVGPFNEQLAQALDDPTVASQIRVLSDAHVVPGHLVHVAMDVLQLWAASPEFHTSYLTADHIRRAIELWSEADNAHVKSISSLSVLELYVLVAMSRLEARGSGPFNLEMVLDEYKAVKEMSRTDFWRKPAVMRAFQRLIDAGLAAMISRRSHGCGHQLQYEAAQCTVSREDIERALDSHSSCPPLLKKWLRDEVNTSTAWASA